MTKAKSAKDLGQECFKVRIVLGGAQLHVLSRTEPKVHRIGEMLVGVELELIEGTPDGDTLGFIRWTEVSAVSWRRA